MSIYDPDDGYEPCTICNELTRNSEQLCNRCLGDVPTLSKRTRRSRDPFGARRNHSRGHGWKANHQS